MSARAKAKKVQGVVVDGRVRDLSEHRSMEYPVSLYSTQCIKSCQSSYLVLGVCQVAFHPATKCFCKTF